MKEITDIIKINNLSYKNIINNLSLSVKKNSYTTISGTNNSGKSTLLKIITGIIATNNSVSINGKYVEEYNKTELYEKISIVTFNPNDIYNHQTVKEGLYKYMYDKKNKEQLFKKVIKTTDISELINNNPNNMTHFEKIKFNIACALSSNPEILLIDNILLKLTKKERKNIISIIKNINIDKNITILLFSNNLTDTIESDYLYILDKGKIALEGLPLEILKKDNEINRLGMDIPFMIDLSVKLCDYDILDDIYLEDDRMIEALWK